MRRVFDQAEIKLRLKGYETPAKVNLKLRRGRSGSWLGFSGDF